MSGFKEFIARGNVLDLAVAVIIGAAFATIVSSLTDDIIMPLIGAIFGGLDLSSHFVILGSIPQGYAGPMTYEALKAAGVPLWGYGQFMTALVNFLILAFVIYQLVKLATRAMRKDEVEAAPSDEVRLLTEIRDELRQRRGGLDEKAV